MPTVKQQVDQKSSPKLVNSNNPEPASKSIKIPEEETLGSTVSMHHYKSRGVTFTVKCNRVDKPWLTA